MKEIKNNTTQNQPKVFYKPRKKRAWKRMMEPDERGVFVRGKDGRLMSVSESKKLKKS